jgi:chaperonin cofactor prefoldin
MSTFNELLHTLKEVCDEKDKRIEFLEGRIEGLNKQYSLIRKRFLDGDYETLRNYFMT